MIIIMLGDVVGEPGLLVLEKRLPVLIKENNADFTIVNGENAAAGFGLTKETLERILASGADAVTGGNHIWEKREFWPVLESDKPVLRPANYPAIKETDSENDNACVVPGRGWMILSKNDISVLVINLQGRELMTPIDCPFRCFDAIIAECAALAACNNHPVDIPIIVDFHAESTEEKEALAYYLDGRASIVAGTHTHVQTADERLLPKGTAYISDLGMTGAMNGIIGMDTNICIKRTLSQIAHHMECADAKEEDCALQGIVVELNENGKALNIKRLNF